MLVVMAGMVAVLIVGLMWADLRSKLTARKTVEGARGLLEADCCPRVCGDTRIRATMGSAADSDDSVSG